MVFRFATAAGIAARLSLSDNSGFGSAFQFQNGAIKVEYGIRIFFPSGDFNSKMVQLKYKQVTVLQPELIHFNSKMVQLKFMCTNTNGNHTNQISIPKWCN